MKTMRTLAYIGLSLFLSMTMACDEGPWVQIILEGWPWKISESAKLYLVPAALKEGKIIDTPLEKELEIIDGQFKISAPNDTADLELPLIEMDDNRCITKYTYNINIRGTKPLREPTVFKENELVGLAPKRCSCSNGWCKISSDMSVNYHAITGLNSSPIFIAGNPPNGGNGRVDFMNSSGPKNISPDDFPPVSSLWIEGRAPNRVWVTTAEERPNVYLKQGNSNEVNRNAESLDSSFWSAEPTIERISGPSDGMKVQLIGYSRATKQAMILDQDAGGKWSNSLDILPPESKGKTSGKTLFGIWIEPGGEDKEIWAVGTDGLLVNRSGGKYSLIEVQQGMVMGTLRSIWCLDSTTCWTVGDSGKIYHLSRPRSQASSKVDIMMQHNHGVRLMGIWGINDRCIWAIGDNGTILFYDGAKWVLSQQGNAELKDIWGKDQSNVWIVGSSGTILTTDPIAINRTIHGQSCSP